MSEGKILPNSHLIVRILSNLLYLEYQTSPYEEETRTRREGEAIKLNETVHELKRGEEIKKNIYSPVQS